MVIGNGNGPAAAARGDEKALAFSRGRLLTAHRGTYMLSLSQAEAEVGLKPDAPMRLADLCVPPWTSPRRPRRVSARGGDAAAARKPPCIPQGATPKIRRALKELDRRPRRPWPYDAVQLNPSMSKTLANNGRVLVAARNATKELTNNTALVPGPLYTAARHELLGGAASAGASLRDQSSGRTAARLDRWLLRAR